MVDAGCVMVGDPCYWVDGMDYDVQICDGWEGSKVISSRTVEGAGVVVSSGFGDGVYPVFIERDPSSGRVARLVVEFILDDEDEEDEEEAANCEQCGDEIDQWDELCAPCAAEAEDARAEDAQAE